MADLKTNPAEQECGKCEQLVVDTYAALKELKSGGTAAEVRQVFVDASSHVSLMTIRKKLNCLAKLGLAEDSENGNARWWKAIVPPELPKV